MANKNMGLIIGIGVAAYYLLNKSGGAGGYTDNQGNPITTAHCGSLIQFNVPGYTRVWLELRHNGVFNYSAPFSVPMPPYQLDCVRDIGTFDAKWYELVNNQQGKLLGETTLVVS